MSENVKTGKTEWKVRVASLATFVGSLAAVSLIETRGVEFVNTLPEGARLIALPLLVSAGAWFAGRAATSRPEYIGQSTIDAVRAHVALKSK
jgi:hypothetical protein